MVKEISEGEEVLVGTFLLFGQPIIIIFDSGETHDQHPWGQVVANLVAREVPLELARQVFCTHLIILDGPGIYVIFGMSWMKLHKLFWI
jgi:hypothetical protein